MVTSLPSMQTSPMANLWVEGLAEKVRLWRSGKCWQGAFLLTSRRAGVGRTRGKKCSLCQKARAKEDNKCYVGGADLFAGDSGASHLAQQLAVQNVLEAALPKTPTSATRVPEQGGGLALTAKMPAISETVRVQRKFGTPVMATVQKEVCRWVFLPKFGLLLQSSLPLQDWQMVEKQTFKVQQILWWRR